MTKDTTDSTSLALAKQEQELKLQAAKLSGETPTGLGKQLTAQATQLQTPNVGSAVLKAIALGMGGQQQRAEAKSADEKNARMMQVIEQQLANTQRLKEAHALATQKKAFKTGIGEHGEVVISALEAASSPDASPETIAQTNNTISNLAQSLGQDLNKPVNNASIDPIRQVVNVSYADGSTDSLSYPMLLATIGETNPELQKSGYSRLYTKNIEQQAQVEGEVAATKTISEVEALAKQLEAQGTPLTEQQKQALNIGAKVTLTGEDVGLTKGATTASQKENLNQYQNSIKLKDTINQIRGFIKENPDAAGLRGQVRKYAGALAGFVNPIQEQFQTDVSGGLVDPSVVKKMNSLGADTTALETLETLMAYQFAKAQDPQGKVSNADFDAAKASINLTGVTARPESIGAQLGIIEERADSLIGRTQEFLKSPTNYQSQQIPKNVQDLLDKYRR